jgi:hypothetical protein
MAALGAAGCGDDYIVFPEAVAPLTPTADAGTSGGAAGAGAGGGGGRAGAGGSAAGGAGRAGAGAGGRAGAGGSSAGAGGSAGAGLAGSGGVDAPDAGGSDASVGEPVPVDPGGVEQPEPVDPGAGEEPPPVDPEPAEPVCEIAVDAVTALPYEEVWQTTNDTDDVVNVAGCQVCDNTGDHIVTFTAPQSGTFRFSATSSGDVELAVYTGDCDAEPDDAACGEDLEEDNDGDDLVQVDVEIAQGDSVTVVVSESCEEDGGEGTLTIDVAD